MKLVSFNRLYSEKDSLCAILQRQLWCRQRFLPFYLCTKLW